MISFKIMQDDQGRHDPSTPRPALKTRAQEKSGRSGRDDNNYYDYYDVTGVEGAELLTTPVGPSGSAIHRTA